MSVMVKYLVILKQFQMSWQQLCPADRTTNHSAVRKTTANPDQNHIERSKYYVIIKVRKYRQIESNKTTTNKNTQTLNKIKDKYGINPS